MNVSGKKRRIWVCNRYLNFRFANPEVDPPKWQKWVTVRLADGKVRTGELPIDFWGSFEENYERHRR